MARGSSEPPLATFCIQLRHSDWSPGSRATRSGRSAPSCGWVHYPKSNQASAVAILQDGEVLMVRRKHEPFKGPVDPAIRLPGVRRGPGSRER